MQVPLELSYTGEETEETVNQLVSQHAQDLEDACPHIASCHVFIDQPHKHPRTGTPYRVHLLVRVPPGHEVVVKRGGPQGDMHEELAMMVADAFDAARRQCRELAEQQDRNVKRHPEQELQALVVRLFPDEGYGFLKTPEGGEVYFHRNSVLHGDFERLTVGTGVRFSEEMGEKGPQATTVAIVDKPGAHVGQVEEPALKPPLGWE